MDSRADLLQQLQSSEQAMLVTTVVWSLLPCPAEGFHLQIFFLSSIDSVHSFWLLEHRAETFPYLQLLMEAVHFLL